MSPADPPLADASSVWAGLGLSCVPALISVSFPSNIAVLTPDDAAAALLAPSPPPGAASSALAASTEAYAAALPAARAAAEQGPKVVGALSDVQRKLEALTARLDECEDGLVGMLSVVREKEREQEHCRVAEAHVSAFVEEVMLDPALVRHIVDGRVGEARYVECLTLLRKKVAVFEMRDTKRAAAYKELRPVLDRLVVTAAAKLRMFLLGKIALLRQPNTNIEIIKQNVLLKHCELVRFLDEFAQEDFLAVKTVYVQTMAPLYHSLFQRYSSALMALRANVGSADSSMSSPGAIASSSSSSAVSPIPADSLVGTLPPQFHLTGLGTLSSASFSFLRGTSSSAQTHGAKQAAPSSPEASSEFSRQVSLSMGVGGSDGDSSSLISSQKISRNARAVDTTTAAAVRKSVGLFSVANRIDVLTNIDSPAIVLAIAEDSGLRFYYEEVQRSLGRMLTETWASEHFFCGAFLGVSDVSLFSIFFKAVVNLLLETVTAYAATSTDIVGILLGIKVNESQRASAQLRSIPHLEDYFIRVNIALKPKFKRLFEANISSIADSTKQKDARILFPGATPKTHAHVITRRFADLSSSVLTIAAYGATDDAILDGLRRMRAEYYGLLTVMSAHMPSAKARYTFLVNNVDSVLTVYATRGVESTAEARFFNELQVGHTTAYVEAEVGDHFPDLVKFVRDHDRRARSTASSSSSSAVKPPSETRVRSILNEFASNWLLGIVHMRDNVLRAFPNFRAGIDILRALFTRLLAYQRRCEEAIDADYPILKNICVSSTEISYEVRQLSQPLHLESS
jgi:Vps52 / Sac2 family